MKSGLEGRNNVFPRWSGRRRPTGLNEVRPRRPEQCWLRGSRVWVCRCLNEVRPRRPEQSSATKRSPPPWTPGLNEVRPRRPEQFRSDLQTLIGLMGVSMKSGLEGRNNKAALFFIMINNFVSMKSGLEGRNNPKRRCPPANPATVSMKSGLEGRNNHPTRRRRLRRRAGLNEVRPRRPEQSRTAGKPGRRRRPRLNEVRPRRPEQYWYTQLDRCKWWWSQ